MRASAPDAFGGARHYESVTCHDPGFVQTITACIVQQVDLGLQELVTALAGFHLPSIHALLTWARSKTRGLKLHSPHKIGVERRLFAAPLDHQGTHNWVLSAENDTTGGIACTNSSKSTTSFTAPLGACRVILSSTLSLKAAHEERQLPTALALDLGTAGNATISHCTPT